MLRMMFIGFKFKSDDPEIRAEQIEKIIDDTLVELQSMGRKIVYCKIFHDLNGEPKYVKILHDRLRTYDRDKATLEDEYEVE